MVNILDINSIQPQEDDKYLLDTNIILFLYNSYNNDLAKTKSQIAIYGDFFDKAIKANSKMYISSLVLAEFINVIVRREFNIERKGYGCIQDNDFKAKFRPSQSYKDVMTFIKSVVSTILKACNKIDDNFSIIDIDKLIKGLENDYNDEYFAYLSKQEDLKLVTDDGDYNHLNLPIEIITGNKKLLTIT